MDLVFLTSKGINADAYTTGDVIAKCAKVKRRTINKLITHYKSDLEEFGILRFEIAKLNGRGRPRKIYHLNELQATTLITYLDNTKPVREFKKALVKSFYYMRDELLKMRISYGQGKEVSKNLADTINNSDLADVKHIYPNLNRLIYKQALGVSTNELKRIKNIPKNGNISQYLSVRERDAVNKVKSVVVALVSAGYDYQMIKATLENKGIIYRISTKPAMINS